jgi:hypothetical protein
MLFRSLRNTSGVEPKMSADFARTLKLPRLLGEILSQTHKKARAASFEMAKNF